MKKRTSRLTAQALRTLLMYNPESGEFHWISRVGNIPAGAAAGSKGKRGYIDISINKERHGAHRLAWLYVHGDWPTGEIDHWDGCKSNNRIGNLRDITHAANTQNLRSAHRRNISAGLLGVRRSDTKSVRFNAMIMVGGKVKSLGSFGDPNTAHQAYLAAKRELHEGCTI